MIRRHLVELGFGVLALAALIPLTHQALRPDEALHPGKEGSLDKEEGSGGVLSKAALRDTPRPENLVNTCKRGRVELTFDDGPDVYTPQVLRVLRAYKVRATFYVVGAKVTARAGLVRAAIADGHRVENHSWHHPHMADLDREDIRRELSDTQRAVTAAGAPRPTLFRPPYGSTSGAVEEEARALGLRVVRWSIDTHDWRGRAPDDIAASVLDRTGPGSVVLMHDGLANSATTVRALPAIISGLRARGFCTALPEG